MFYIGQKVVCVDDNPRPGYRKPSGIKTGDVYTIRWIGMYEALPWFESSLCVRLYEVNRGQDKAYPNDTRLYDTPFLVTRFRPLDERKTDISVFTKMLIPEKVLND